MYISVTWEIRVERLVDSEKRKKVINCTAKNTTKTVKFYSVPFDNSSSESLAATNTNNHELQLQSSALLLLLLLRMMMHHHNCGDSSCSQSESIGQEHLCNLKMGGRRTVYVDGVRMAICGGASCLCTCVPGPPR
jgi:hypothetical protein